MKFEPAIGLLGIILFAPLARTQAPNATTESSATFAPLEQWKTAVLAGDPVGLTALYSTAPAAKVTSAGKESNSDGDVDFWLALKARIIKVDVVQTSSPQPGVQVVVFQAEVEPAAAVTGTSQTVYVTELQSWQQQAGEWRLLAVQTHRRSPSEAATQQGQEHLSCGHRCAAGDQGSGSQGGEGSQAPAPGLRGKLVL